jgi:predicted Fe-Mo cluster-binding NifX family protein
MSSFIAIMDNPYFAVSATDGTFTINNVPAGKQSVKAWHEVMGTQTQMVDVQAGKTTTVDFTFTSGQKPAGAGASIHELVIPHNVAVASIIASR